MMYKTIAGVMLASLCSFASAQTDSTKSTPKSQTQHYLGVQANQLFRQILSLSDDDTPINNPYLFTYTVNGPSGFGLNVGLGYEFDEIKTSDGQIDRETNIDDFSVRLGPEKKFWVGKRWLASGGFDVVIKSLKSETINKIETDFGRSNISTTSKSTGWGFGPRFELSFQISNNIFIGTEVTYYFQKMKEKGEINSSITTKQTDFNGNIIEVTETEKSDTEDKTKELQFTVPAVLFLVLRM
jgi:hypothetical protein